MIENTILSATIEAIYKLYNVRITEDKIQLQNTNKDFEGDITIVTFTLSKISKKSPDKTAEDIGNYLISQIPQIAKFNVIKGFLNILLKEDYWFDFLNENYENQTYGLKQKTLNKDFSLLPTPDSKTIVIEYSSPNTNKPLHLGHIRNNLLGFSIAEILEATGRKVVKVNLVNDRGIHICKSMLAWLKWGNGETPESSGLKGDHLVGKYYVLFDNNYKSEIEELMGSGLSFEDAEKNAPLIIEAQELLRKWERGDVETMNTWKIMNSWVYNGFEETYTTLGVDFDRTYYESDTYLLGKDIVKEGLAQGVFFTKEDGSVWIDLTSDGLDEKLVLRADGTSVYITQDLGTAQQRYDEYNPEKLIYVVGSEQNYHFDVLKLILKKLGKPYVDSVFHLSYGMVELPEGKMKSREGTVVDADDLIEEMYLTAKKTTEALGKTNISKVESTNSQLETQNSELETLYRIIGLAALKYFILKVDPQKNMLFNPQESIDFNGNTGPFIQYTYARIQSLLRKSLNFQNLKDLENLTKHQTLNTNLLQKEKIILKLIHEFPNIVQQAAESLSPALVANYVYELAKEYNAYYQEVPVLRAETNELISFRLKLSEFTAKVIKSSMSLLGISVPDKM